MSSCSNIDIARDLTISVENIAKQCYLQYGSYVNNQRAIANVVDGLKVSYKRLIYMSLLQPKGELIKSSEFVPKLSKIHPHSTVGCEDLNANLVRSGVFTGEGFFGTVNIDGEVLPHAATRYTHNRLSDLYWDILGDLYKEVPYVESPEGPLEPLYLPLAIPLCLYQKNLVQGLGVAVNCLYPNFSPKSMFAAWKNNDPTLLEPNVDLILDKDNSELKKLWETGKGRLIYVYRTSRTMSDDGKAEGVLFETVDGTDIFTPNTKVFKKLVEEGKVFIENETIQGMNRLFVGRIPGTKGITVDDIEALARKACFQASTFQLNVTDGTSVFRIGLRDWLNYTLNNYKDLIEKVNKKRIEKCKFDILVQQSIPAIGDYILNKNPKATDEEICKVLKIDQEVVSQVMSKPISYLRNNKDTSDRVKALKEKLKGYESFDAIKYTEEIINKL